jgi:vacuolar-type H+-ATPase subunit E/Vma4
MDVAFALFTEDFDLPASPEPSWKAEPDQPEGEVLPPEPEMVPTEPVFTRAELEAEIAAAREAAIAEMQLSQTAEARDLLVAIECRLAETREQALDAIEQIAEATCDVMLAAFRALLPSVSERFAAPEIRAMLAILQDSLRAEPHVTVFLADNCVDLLQDELARLTALIPGGLTVQARSDMPAGDVVVEWKGGRARRDTTALLKTIDQLLSFQPTE